LIGVNVDVWILCLGEEQRAGLNIELLAMRNAKGEEPIVGGLTEEMLNDFERATAEQRVTAESGGLEPASGRKAIGEDFGADGLVHRRILIGQKTEKCLLLALARFGGTL